MIIHVGVGVVDADVAAAGHVEVDVDADVDTDCHVKCCARLRTMDGWSCMDGLVHVSKDLLNARTGSRSTAI